MILHEELFETSRAAFLTPSVRLVVTSEQVCIYRYDLSLVWDLGSVFGEAC